MFLSFEGIDGSGKSTQAAMLAAALSDAGFDVLSVREPGGTSLGEAIRGLLLDPDRAMNPRAELLLFSAARAQMVDEVVRPALEDGVIVIADRFFDSSTAYQGAGRGIAATEWMAGLHEFATGGLRPDLTFLVDLDPAEAQARRGSREADRMEQGDHAFFERVRSGYLELAVDAPDRVTVLDGRRDRSALHAEIWSAVESALTASGRMQT